MVIYDNEKKPQCSRFGEAWWKSWWAEQERKKAQSRKEKRAAWWASIRKKRGELTKTILRFRHPEYSIWKGAKARTGPGKVIKNYNERGIKMCPRWRRSFLRLFEDVGPMPTRKHSLDRINNDGNYEPGNCRWATRLQQLNNTRRNVRLKHDGRVQTVAQWSRELKIVRETISIRLRTAEDFQADLDMQAKE